MLYTLATRQYATNCCLYKQWNVNEILFTTCLLQIFKLLQSIFCSKFLTQIPFLPSAGFISVNMRVVICSA